MKTRLIALGLAAPLALAGCASSVTGTGATATTGASASSTGGASATASPTNAAASLAAQLTHGLYSAHSAHLTLRIDAAGHTISGGGDELLAPGKVVGFDLTESISGLQLGLIVISGKTYVKLPSALNHSGKPWQLVTSNSSNAVVRQLASSLASTQSSASLDGVTTLIDAARSIRQTGTGSLQGSPTTTYAVDVDPTKLPGTYVGKQALIAAGVTSIPVTITVDSQGRPVSAIENFSVQGQQVNVRISITDYNKPVHITAPPKDQISTS